MKARLFTLSVLLAIASLGNAKECRHNPNDRAITPVVREKEGWIEKHQKQKLAALGDRADIVMIGDSMIERWPAKLVADAFGGASVLKLGIGGDQTQQILWRLADLDLSKQQPAYTVLMIGTNNLTAKAPACSVATGIKAIVQEIRSRFPDTKLVIVGVPPRGEGLDFRREDIRELNAMLRNLADDKTVVLDPVAILEGQGGEENILPDLLHFSATGYRELTKLLRSALPEKAMPGRRQGL